MKDWQKDEDGNDLEPYINNEYQCETCGNVGKSHPQTSYCWECDEDNWTLLTE